MITTKDFTELNAADLFRFIQGDKYKLLIKSRKYNATGAYWPFENSYLPDDVLYKALTSDQSLSLKKLYVPYYNNQKKEIEKKLYNMPSTITEDDIESITVYALPLTYADYYL